MVLPTGDVTLNEILADFKKAKDDNRGMHDNIKRWRNWYDFNHYTERGSPKPGEERFQDPTPTAVVDMAVGIILAHPIEWRARGYANTGAEQEDTSKIEKYMAGTVEINNYREGYDLDYETAFHMVRDGAAVIHTVWDPLLADEHYMGIMPVPDLQAEGGVREVPHYHENPTRIQSIDPLKTYWVKGGPRRWIQVFRTEKMSVYDVETLYGIELKNWAHLPTSLEKRRQKGELVDVWRFEQKEVPIPAQGLQAFAENIGVSEPETELRWVVQRAIIFENEWVHPLQDTPYKDIPYDIGFYKPIGREKSEDWTHSVIRPLESSVETLENAINRRARQITLLSSLPIVTQAIPGRQIQLDRALGSHVQLQPDEDIRFPQWPGNPPDVELHVQFLRKRLESAGFSETALDEGTAVSGYALSQITDYNRIRLTQPVKHLELLWSNVARKVMDLTATFAPNASIRVYGTMKGEDFAESVMSPDLSDYLVTANLKPEFPGEQTQKHAMATQVKGTLSEFTIMERYLDIPQPDDEFERKIYEMVLTNPMAIEFAIMKKIGEMAQAGDEIAMMMLQRMQQQQAQGEGGQEGPRPEQPTGTPSATGEPTSGEPPGQSEADGVEQQSDAAPRLLG